MNLSPDKLWDKCLALIRENISEQQYNAWFKRTVFESYNEESKTVLLRVPSPFVYEYLEENYVDLLRKVLTRTFGMGVNLSYRIVTDSENKKTQVITPTLQGEMIYDVVDHSIRSLLNPELTASWEKGLNYVAEGSITSDEYMRKLDHFITSRTVGVKGLNNQYQLRACYEKAAGFYPSVNSNKTTGRTKTGNKSK